MENKVGAMGGGRVWMLCMCIAAIYAAYLTQGIVQENVSTTRYGEKQERFEHLVFLNLAQNVVCFIWSLLMLQLWPNKKGTQAPLTAYWTASISNAIGPACGIVALKYISYPAQVMHMRSLLGADEVVSGELCQLVSHCYFIAMGLILCEYPTHKE
jgi:cytochrome bd-type quinol oxidase subunit 2